MRKRYELEGKYVEKHKTRNCIVSLENQKKSSLAKVMLRGERSAVRMSITHAKELELILSQNTSIKYFK